MWKEIKNFKDYLINENGEIKSKDRIIHSSDGRTTFRKGKVLTQQLAENGYLFVTLFRDKKRYIKKVHRLVAENYVPNQTNLPFVNHKDENKQNNSVENLEWCDRFYNINYGTAIERANITNRKNKKGWKPILQIDKDTNEIIKEWDSSKEVSRVLGFGDSNILKCCKGIYKHSYGFKWSFSNKNNSI